MLDDTVKKKKKEFPQMSSSSNKRLVIDMHKFFESLSMVMTAGVKEKMMAISLNNDVRFFKLANLLNLRITIMFRKIAYCS